MKIQPVVKQETAKIAAGVAVLSVLMIAVFLMLGRFDLSVLLGALLGSAAAIGNFFLMALSVQKAADRMKPLPRQDEESGQEEEGEEDAPVRPEVKAAQKRMQLSYTLRLFLLAGIAALAVALPQFDSYAALIPMLFPRIVISLLGILQKNRKEA